MLTLRRPRFAIPLTISVKMGMVFSLIVLAVVANVFFVRSMLEESNGVAVTINMAGRLRLMSQQIALSTTNALQGWSPGKAAAEAQLGEYELTLSALTRGGHVFGYDIKRVAEDYKLELDLIRRDWNTYHSQIETYLAMPAAATVSAAQLGKLTASSTRMLTDAEQLVQSLTLDAQRRQERALNATYLLAALDVLTLFALSWVVRMQIVYPLRRLARHSHQLADGNYQARIHFDSNDELGQLAQALNYAAQRIAQERHGLIQAEAMFRGFAENSVVGVFIAQDGKFKFVNAKMADMFDYTQDGMRTSVDVFDLVTDDDRPILESNIEKRLRGDPRSTNYQCRARRKSGAMFDAEVFGSTMELDGRPATIGIMLDISERKRGEEARLLAHLVYENTSEAMTITDTDGYIIDVNPAFTKITGYARHEVLGRRVSMLQSGRHDKRFYQAMWHALTTVGYWQGEIWNRRKNGEVYAEWLTINTSYHSDGSVFRRMALFSDITQKKQVDDLVWHQANFDSLTNLPNRLMFRDRLEQELRKAHRAGLSMGLLFIDLDHFKEVNDSLGHAVGDQLLKQAAQRLCTCVRESDTVARLGGDEFTVIIGELNEPIHAERIAQKILQRLEEPFVLEQEVAYITASIGITFYPQDTTELEELLKNADQAMYAAKERGRDQFHYFTSSMQAKAQARRRIASDLRTAVAQRQLMLLYQPIVDLRTGKVNKAEALIRWQHPARGLIGPNEFIPIAEETGQIAAIGDWVFREAVQQLKNWRQWNPTLQISVNTSPAQYRNGGIGHDAWIAFLDAQGVPPTGMNVEITEGLLLDTNEAITEQLLRLRDAGMKVSLDDFGTGYSSLSYLSKLDIDFLKIDRSFITGLSAGSDNLALYEAMIVMAHKLGIQVIAEGVETIAQRDQLLNLGCDYGQGYLFARPLTPGQFEKLLCAAL